MYLRQPVESVPSANTGNQQEGQEGYNSQAGTCAHYGESNTGRSVDRTEADQKPVCRAIVEGHGLLIGICIGPESGLPGQGWRGAAPVWQNTFLSRRRRRRPFRARKFCPGCPRSPSRNSKRRELVEARFIGPPTPSREGCSQPFCSLSGDYCSLQRSSASNRRNASGWLAQSSRPAERA